MIDLLDQLGRTAPGVVNALRRRQPRGRCDFPAEIHAQGEVRNASLRDFNELGAFVEEAPSQVELGEQGVLRVDPGPGLNNPPAGYLERPFVVVRKDGEGFGIRFVELDDGILREKMKLPLPSVCIRRTSGAIESGWALYNAHVPFEFLERLEELPPRTAEDARILSQREPVAICCRETPEGARMFRVVSLSELSRLQKECVLHYKNSEITQLHRVIATLKDERDALSAEVTRLKDKVKQVEAREKRLLRGMGLAIESGESSLTNREFLPPVGCEGDLGIPT